MKDTAAAFGKKTVPATVFSGGKGRAELLQQRFLHKPSLYQTAPGRGLPSGQGEVDLYFRIHFDRFAVEQIRLISPLLHRIDGRRGEHRMPADQR
jgi:hypothetical protein